MVPPALSTSDCGDAVSFTVSYTDVPVATVADCVPAGSRVVATLGVGQARAVVPPTTSKAMPARTPPEPATVNLLLCF